MTPFKVLTNTEYQRVYKQLNKTDIMTKYRSNGVFLLYCDNVLIETAKQFEEIQNSKAKHFYQFMFLPLKMFRLIESNEGITLCRTEELKEYLKT